MPFSPRAVPAPPARPTTLPRRATVGWVAGFLLALSASTLAGRAIRTHPAWVPATLRRVDRAPLIPSALLVAVADATRARDAAFATIRMTDAEYAGQRARMQQLPPTAPATFRSRERARFDSLGAAAFAHVAAGRRATAALETAQHALAAARAAADAHERRAAWSGLVVRALTLIPAALLLLGLWSTTRRHPARPAIRPLLAFGWGTLALWVLPAWPREGLLSRTTVGTLAIAVACWRLWRATRPSRAATPHAAIPPQSPSVHLDL